MEDQLGQKEVINQLHERKRYLGQIVSENLANHSIKRSMSSTTSESCANGLFNKSSADDPYSRSCANSPFSRSSIIMKSEWKKLQKDQLMKRKKDKPAKKVVKLAEVEHMDDDEFKDYEADSDAASVSSHDSSSLNIGGNLERRK